MSLKYYDTSDRFDEYFAVQLASTAKQKDDAFSIRYNVYCKERGWEDEHRFPDQKERDEFDASSFHCVIRHRSSDLPAACVRVVPGNDRTECNELPFEKHCSNHVDSSYLQRAASHRSSLCEISRLAVDNLFRGVGQKVATGEMEYEKCIVEFTDEERKLFPLISVASFLSAIAVVDITGRGNTFAVMEPFLPKLLRRVGIYFDKAGEDFDYHGKRALYHLDGNRAPERLKPEYRDVYEMIKFQILSDHTGIFRH